MNRTDPQPQELEALVERAQGGDSTAFENLVRHCYQQIYRWAWVHTGDPDDADDVTQEVLVVLHRKVKTYAGRARFSSWLFQVTRNAALQHERKVGRALRLKRRAREVAVDDSHSVDGITELDGARTADVVRTLFQQLPVRQREVFDLADLQGFSPSEIGRMLGMKAVTVRANLCKARRALRGAILERHPELVEGLTE